MRTTMARLCVLIGIVALAGCSPPDAAQGTIAAATGDVPAANQPRDGDPCKLLSTTEVNRVFPGAGTGERDLSLEKYGISRCRWKSADEQLNVQVTGATDSSVAEELEALMLAASPPGQTLEDLGIRIEIVDGIGDQAVAVIERADATRGRVESVAIFVSQRGDQQLWLIAHDLAKRDRPAALAALADLGRTATERL